MLPYGTPKRHFPVHFAFRIPTKCTLGALLVPLFGQFLEAEFSEVQIQRCASLYSTTPKY
jgi:hypothetical protein